MRKEASRRTETRDAILWDVLPAQKLCRIKIQGSNTLITANYPENWEQNPAYLKPGNAVKVMHTGGNRNRIEIIGHGQCIPTPVGGSMFPVFAVGQDAVLGGCQVKAFPDPLMGVYIEPGTYRINGTTYSLGVLGMSETNTVTMGSGIPFDGVAQTFTINAAHSSLYRIDIFSVGTSGVVTYTAGTAALSPVQPALPAGHILLGWVFIPPNTTAITQDLINAAYVDPFVSQLGYVVTPDNELIWSEPTVTITVSVLDQYKNAILGTNWGIKAEIVSGTGYIDDVGITTKTRYTSKTNHQVTFVYYRNQEIGFTEKSPTIKFTLTQSTDIQTQTILVLYDELGGFLF